MTARPSRSRHRSARVVRTNAEIIDTTSDTVTSQFVEEDINRPTGKLTDCQARFCRRPTGGLKLLGFAIRERRGGPIVLGIRAEHVIIEDLVCEPAHSSTRLSSGSVETVLILPLWA